MGDDLSDDKETFEIVFHGGKQVTVVVDPGNRWQGPLLEAMQLLLEIGYISQAQMLDDKMLHVEFLGIGLSAYIDHSNLFQDNYEGEFGTRGVSDSLQTRKPRREEIAEAVALILFASTCGKGTMKDLHQTMTRQVFEHVWGQRFILETQMLKLCDPSMTKALIDDASMHEAYSRLKASCYAGGLNEKPELAKHQLAALWRMQKLENDPTFRGGLQAEEMGMGKTACVLALICLQKHLDEPISRKLRPQEDSDASRRLHQSRIIQISPDQAYLSKFGKWQYIAEDQQRAIWWTSLPGEKISMDVPATIYITAPHLVRQVLEEAERFTRLRVMTMTSKDIMCRTQHEHEALLDKIGKADLIVTDFQCAMLASGCHINQELLTKNASSFETTEPMDYPWSEAEYTTYRANILDYVRFRRAVMDEVQEAGEQKVNRRDRFKLYGAGRINAVCRWCVSGTPFTCEEDFIGILKFLRHPFAEPLSIALKAMQVSSSCPSPLHDIVKDIVSHICPGRLTKMSDMMKIPIKMILQDLGMACLRPMTIRLFSRCAINPEKIKALSDKINGKMEVKIGVPYAALKLDEKAVAASGYFGKWGTDREDFHACLTASQAANYVALGSQHSPCVKTLLGMPFKMEQFQSSPTFGIHESDIVFPIPQSDRYQVSHKHHILLQRIAEIVKCGEKVIVFCDSNPRVDQLYSILDHCPEHIPNFFKPGKDKLNGIVGFLKVDGGAALVMSIYHTCSGLNLQQANHVIFAAPFFELWRIDQAIGRVLRMGQCKQEITIDFIVARTDFEEVQMQRLLETICSQTADKEMYEQAVQCRFQNAESDTQSMDESEPMSLEAILPESTNGPMSTLSTHALKAWVKEWKRFQSSTVSLLALREVLWLSHDIWQFHYEKKEQYTVYRPRSKTVVGTLYADVKSTDDDDDKHCFEERLNFGALFELDVGSEDDKLLGLVQARRKKKWEWEITLRARVSAAEKHLLTECRNIVHFLSQDWDPDENICPLDTHLKFEDNGDIIGLKDMQSASALEHKDVKGEPPDAVPTEKSSDAVPVVCVDLSSHLAGSDAHCAKLKAISGHRGGHSKTAAGAELISLPHSTHDATCEEGQPEAGTGSVLGLAINTSTHIEEVANEEGYVHKVTDSSAMERSKAASSDDEHNRPRSKMQDHKPIFQWGDGEGGRMKTCDPDCEDENAQCKEVCDRLYRVLMQQHLKFKTEMKHVKLSLVFAHHGCDPGVALPTPSSMNCHSLYVLFMYTTRDGIDIKRKSEKTDSKDMKCFKSDYYNEFCSVLDAEIRASSFTREVASCGPDLEIPRPQLIIESKATIFVVLQVDWQEPEKNAEPQPVEFRFEAETKSKSAKDLDRDHSALKKEYGSLKQEYREAKVEYQKARQSKDIMLERQQKKQCKELKRRIDEIKDSINSIETETRKHPLEDAATPDPKRLQTSQN